MERYKFLIWGTGRTALHLLRFMNQIGYQCKFEIIGFIDNEGHKWGTEFEGYPIYAPSQIVNLKFDYIDIFSFHYDEIKKQILEDLKLPETVIKDVFCDFREKLIEQYEKTESEELLEIIKQLIEAVRSRNK